MIIKDFYEEKGVKAKPNTKGTVMMWILGAVALIGLVLAYWEIACLIITVVTGVTFVMMFRERHIEYDYCVSTDEIEIAKIINRKRRRTAILFDMNNIRLVAPADSMRLSNERERNPQMRFTDYTAVEPTDKVYGFVLELKGINALILMEPTESMMEHLRQMIPNKIYED